MTVLTGSHRTTSLETNEPAVFFYHIFFRQKKVEKLTNVIVVMLLIMVPLQSQVLNANKAWQLCFCFVGFFHSSEPVCHQDLDILDVLQAWIYLQKWWCNYHPQGGWMAGVAFLSTSTDPKGQDRVVIIYSGDDWMWYPVVRKLFYETIYAHFMSLCPSFCCCKLFYLTLFSIQ